MVKSEIFNASILHEPLLHEKHQQHKVTIFVGRHFKILVLKLMRGNIMHGGM